MPEASYLEAYQRRLLELGCPAARLQRHVREMADHLEDLKQAAREEGLSEADAAARAGEWLGEPAALAENAARALRQSSWWWRHRLIGFCLLPLLAIIAWITGGLLLGCLAWRAFLPAAQVQAMADGGSGFDLLELGVQGVFHSAIAFASILFCWLALRSPAGMAWAALSCAVCALYGLFGYVGIKPHLVFAGFASSPDWPNLISSAIPLGVAAVAFARHWRLRKQLASCPPGHGGLPLRSAACLIAALALSLTGCAATKEKPHPTRGWIGGEYRLAKPPTWYRQAAAAEGVVCDPAIARQFGSDRKSAVKLTALGTNTPAHLAGLCQDDLILELNGQPVTRLKDFNRVVDRSKPGTALPVKINRNGQTMEFNVLVGCETYRREGLLALALPSIVKPWDLWPNPGFSLVFLGCYKNPGVRHELDGRTDVWERGWSTWLVLFEVAKGNRILSQSCVPPHTTAPSPRQP
jgi:hypothetical protein